MALKVIGAGLGRTGTMSLKVALEQLGFGPCHHMTELPNHPERWPLWEAFFEGKPANWDEIFEGYNSTVDAPSCFVYRELAEFYPDARVILTLRDPDRWFESTQRTIAAPGYREQLAKTPIGKLTAGMTSYQVRKRAGTTSGTDARKLQEREAMIASYHAHNDEVRRVIAPERLLEYEVKQGWEPLCKFLGVPVPDTDFPHANEQGKWKSILPMVSKM
ncbi:MAG TPA: sulfotransferase [Alphaproteobacteria bacterium]|nr:sulfotransferase [Alphaproteobacteria bacterium]